MAGNCSKDDCYPEETGCNYEGCEVLKECPHYKKTSATETLENTEEIDSENMDDSGDSVSAVRSAE